MSELGSGSGTGYPGALDTDNILEVDSPNAGKTKARADVPNDSNAAIVAIETELGTDPAGTKADLKTYLQTEHATDGTHGDITATGFIGPISPTSVTLAGSAWPSFAAYDSGGSSMGDGATVKIGMGAEAFDTNSNYDHVTNFRFTPTVAGKYLISATTAFPVGDTKSFRIHIHKNGAEFKNSVTSQSGSSTVSVTVTDIVDMNGSTDYVEAFARQNSGGTISTLSGQANTYWSGSRIA